MQDKETIPKGLRLREDYFDQIPNRGQFYPRDKLLMDENCKSYERKFEECKGLSINQFCRLIERNMYSCLKRKQMIENNKIID